MTPPKSPPKSTSGETIVALSGIQRLVVVMLTALLLGTFGAVWDSRTQIQVLGVKFENMEEKIEFRDSEVARLKGEMESIKNCVDHHIAGEGHIITTRRIERVERDIKDLVK